MTPKKIEIKEKKTRKANTKLELNIEKEKDTEGSCQCSGACKTPKFIFAILVTAIIVGGLVYLWQKSEMKSSLKKIAATEKADLIQKNDDLNKELAGVKDELSKLKDSAKSGQKINLYYYNQAIDQQKTPGTPSCDQASVLTIIREIPKSDNPIDEAIKLLIKGEVTDEENKAGFTTEFPHPGLKYLSSKLSGGTLTLTFDDPDNFLSGGACRVGLLRAQLEKTAMQFPGVNRVIFSPESLLQP